MSSRRNNQRRRPSVGAALRAGLFGSGGVRDQLTGGAWDLLTGSAKKPASGGGGGVRDQLTGGAWDLVWGGARKDKGPRS